MNFKYRYKNYFKTYNKLIINTLKIIDLKALEI